MTPWWMDLLTMAAIAVGAYLWLILVLRLSGKRSLSKLNAFDFSVTVAFGSALATIIISRDVGIFRGAVALAMLALLQYSLTKLSQWSKFVRRTVRSRPTLLVRHGMLYEEALGHERVTVDEIAEAIRKSGRARLDGVGAVVLETDGSFSIVPASDKEFDLLYDVRIMGEPSSAPIQRRQRKAVAR